MMTSHRHLGVVVAAAAALLSVSALPAVASPLTPSITTSAPSDRSELQRPPSCAPATGVQVTCNLDYDGDGAAAHRLDIYRPTGSDDAPVVVMIHGGGWLRGDRTAMARQATYFAQHGLAAVAIDYTLSTTRTPSWPTAFEDVEAAVAWIQAHDSSYGMDSSAMGAYGHSAGGNLAGLLGANGASPIIATVTLSGVLDLGIAYADSERTRLEINQFLGCTPTECPSTSDDASPTSWVDKDDGSMLIFNSADEMVPLSQATEMDRVLGSKNVEHELVVLPGTLHAARYECVSATVAGKRQPVLDAALTWLGSRLLDGSMPAPGGYC